MSDEMRLARVDLGPGWIDLGYGEPVAMQEIFTKYVDPSMVPSKEVLLRSPYQPPIGHNLLTQYLEDKYGAKVVITNGAKQGIAAVMHSLKTLGHVSCCIPTPYWVSIPTLISDAGLHVQVLQSESTINSKAMLVTSPNNPDGKELSKTQLEEITADAKAEGIILIHDAAYYTPVYMEKPDEITKVGDAQIYSFAKMYGLSGLRVGYVVVHNEELLPGIVEFVERSTSGVSTASQMIALGVETFFADNPEMKASFERDCRDAIAASRAELANLRPEVLIPEPCKSNSMFAWLKVGPELNNVAAKVNILPGDIFGRPGYMRMNLAVNSDLIKTAVERLNGGVSDDQGRSGEVPVSPS